MTLEKFAVIDIETNGLFSHLVDYSSFPYKLNASAKLWTVVVTAVESGESFTANLEEITRDWLEKTLEPFDYIVAHNGVKFDFLMLQLFGTWEYRVGYPGESDTVFGRKVAFVDTLIMSRLLNPDRFGGHSLEAWGERLGGEQKMDYRQACIEAGYITSDSPIGAEFSAWNPIMPEYCKQDTVVNVEVFKHLFLEFASYSGWKKPFKMETKLADLGIRRENLGFWFDKELALECLKDLTDKMNELESRVLPNIPVKKMGKTEAAKFIPPKNQITKKGEVTKNMENFTNRIGGELISAAGMHYLRYEGKTHQLPFENAVKTHVEAQMKDLDHIKMHLINLGWSPVEWRERDLTKDSKKQNLPYEKRVEALDRWYNDTIAGKYKKSRLSQFDLSPDDLYHSLLEKLEQDWPVRVPTSPMVRVGVEKELCPKLTELGEKVAFAKDFALYLTYKHRKSSIAGGDIEDIDFDVEYPNKGYLAYYREADGRVPTPAIEIGTSTTRYLHRNVVNIPRSGSPYGEKMRSLFGAGSGFVQLAYDFSSLEARIESHEIWNYEGGPEMSEALLAKKPFDIHSVTAVKNGIDRDSAKTLNYSVLYGAAPKKIAKSLGISFEEASILCNNFWKNAPALLSLKEFITEQWERGGKKFIKGIDGRRIVTRSPHSLINALLQSGGVICAKYVTVFTMEALEAKGYNHDPFISKPDICSMIEMHDEINYATKPELLSFKTFETEEEANDFVANWQGDQLSAIGHGKKFYVCLPNDFSLAIGDSIKKMENLLGLNVPLGFEWAVGNNWKDCH